MHRAVERVGARALSSSVSPQQARVVGMVVRAGFQGVKHLFREYQRGRISRRTALLILTVPVGGVCVGCYVYGPGNMLAWTLNPDAPVIVVSAEGLSEEERAAQLADVEEAKADLQRVGPVTVLAGTAPPKTWTSSQSKPSPQGEFELVRVGGSTRSALADCLGGNGIGDGGRDALISKPYDRLELVEAWRVENSTLWGAYAAQRMQTQATFRCLTDNRLKARVLTPHIRKGLAVASAPLRAEGGCDSACNEFLLFHGLGDPSKALNIFGAGFNEHFSGVNAGTMFGDGIYLAEDMGKSDQYCAPAARSGVLGRAFGSTAQQRKLDALLWEGRKPPVAADELRYVFVCRAVLGVFLQVGADRQRQLRSAEPVFAAGTRELALIPDLPTPTHYHSEVAEVAPGRLPAKDTHTERGGSSLRFREFIVFKPTLLYPEYLVAYRRTKSKQSTAKAIAA